MKYDDDMRITLNNFFYYYKARVLHEIIILTALKVMYDNAKSLPIVSFNGFLLVIIIIIRSFCVAIGILYHFVLYLQISQDFHGLFHVFIYNSIYLFDDFTIHFYIFIAV